MRAAAVQLQLHAGSRAQPRGRRPADARGRRAPAPSSSCCPRSGPCSARPEQTAAGAEPLDGPALALGARDRARARHRPRRRLDRRARRGPRARLATPRSTSAPTARPRAVYRKIHMFDVEVGGQRLPRVRARGAGRRDRRLARPPAASSSGLTVCYDLRFPELYRDPRRARRARAAPSPPPSRSPPRASTGRCCCAPARSRTRRSSSPPTRSASTRRAIRSGGRSMIVDPWGVVLAQAPDAETFVDRRARPRAPGRDPPHAARRWPTAARGLPLARRRSRA